MPEPSTLIHWPAIRFTSTAPALPCTLALAEEIPISLRYNTMQYAVMMVTAQDVDDFCIGFSLTERIVTQLSEIKSITLEHTEGHIIADLKIPAAAFHRLMQTSRRMTVGRTGCGVCGTEEVDQILRPLPAALPNSPAMELTAIRRGLEALDARQTLNQAVHMVHGAAWCDIQGNIMLVREDVGRHNALDKLIGAQLRTGTGFTGGFCLLTSRCSYEMVQKSIIAGIHTLVAISAPTGLALQMAKQAGLTIVAIARHDAQTLFTGELRNTDSNSISR